jgi:hypothetical protein
LAKKPSQGKSNKGGRPPAAVNREELMKLAERQWTVGEIAAFFRVSRDTIERRFAADIIEAKERGVAKLRDLQWRRAMEGSDKIIVHMSKHYLDQHEKIENKVEVDSRNVNANLDVTKQKLREYLTKLESDV